MPQLFLFLLFLLPYLAQSQRAIDARWQLQNGTVEKGAFYRFNETSDSTKVRVRRYLDPINSYELQLTDYDVSEVAWVVHRGDTILLTLPYLAEVRSFRLLYEDSISLLKYRLPAGEEYQYVLRQKGQLRPISTYLRTEDVNAILGHNCGLAKTPQMVTSDQQMIWLVQSINRCLKSGPDNPVIDTTNRNTWTFNGTLVTGIRQSRTTWQDDRSKKFSLGASYLYRPSASKYLYIGVQSRLFFSHQRFNLRILTSQGLFTERISMVNLYLSPHVQLRLPLRFRMQILVHVGSLHLFPLHYHHRFNITDPAEEWLNWPVNYEDRRKRSVTSGINIGSGFRCQLYDKFWVSLTYQRENIGSPWPGRHRHATPLTQDEQHLLPTAYHLLQVQVEKWW